MIRGEDFFAFTPDEQLLAPLPRTGIDVSTPRIAARSAAHCLRLLDMRFEAAVAPNEEDKLRRLTVEIQTEAALLEVMREPGVAEQVERWILY